MRHIDRDAPNGQKVRENDASAPIDRPSPSDYQSWASPSPRVLFGRDDIHVLRAARHRIDGSHRPVAVRFMAPATNTVLGEVREAVYRWSEFTHECGVPLSHSFHIARDLEAFSIYES